MTQHTSEQSPLSSRTLARCRVYPVLMAIAFAVSLGVLWSGSVPGVSSSVVFPDYLAFHGGAVAAAKGDIASAYAYGIDVEPYRAHIPEDKRIPWYYPPSYLLFVFWLPWVPLWAGAAILLAITLAIFVAAARPLFMSRADIWLILGAPATFVNVLHGQNGFLVAALIALGLGLYRKREVRAGLAIGLLTIKPHFGVLFPVLLLFERRWVTILVTCLTFFAMFCATAALYGMASWQAFLTEGLGAVGSDTQRGALNLAMSSSPFGLLSWLGVEAKAALAVQIVTVASLLGVLTWLVARRTEAELLGAVFASGILLASPHSFVYDWVIHLIPMLILWRCVRTFSPRPLEVAGLIIVYLAPLPALFLGYLDTPIGLPVNLLLFLLCVRRARFGKA